MKKILQINTVTNYGSTGRIAEDLGLIIKKNGWVSYIAYGRKVRESNSIAIRIGNDFGVLSHGIQTRLFDNHGLGSIHATKQLITHIKGIEPNIIHLHNLHGYYINYQMLFKFLRSSNIPVVWTLHDCWPFTGHCVYFTFKGCFKWTYECDKCPQLRSYPSSWFTDRSRANFKAKRDAFTNLNNLTFVAISTWIGDLLRSSFLGNSPSIVINNGIDINTFNRRAPIYNKHTHGLKNKFIILGVANDWTARKGLDDFIKLSKMISVEDQIILIGINSYKKKFLPSKITPIQRTEHQEDLVSLYNCADVFVNPTWEDNFPTTNLEALACGTPVITYRTGGSPEAIDSETGFVVEKGDVNGLLDSINKVKFLGKSFFSDTCRMRAVTKYNKNDRYNEYLHLYDTLTGKSNFKK